jgi:NAD(P)-dependent dehydrogenase (short-subunit alcohol dehydrogenase family)
MTVHCQLGATIACAAAEAALANYSKALLNEVSPKGVRVVRASPGWVETDGAVGLINELAVKQGTDYDGAENSGIRLIGLTRQQRGAGQWAGRSRRSVTGPRPRDRPASSARADEGVLPMT